MNKLLSFEFRNAFRLLYVKLMPVILLVFGIACGFLNDSNNDSSFDGLCQIVVMLSELITIIGGMLLSKDYTQNTIRNKIIVGHSRTNIYLAKQIILTALYLLDVLAFYAGYTVSTALIAGTAQLNRNGLLQSTCYIFVTYFCLSLLACFLTMTVKNALGGALPLLISYGAMMLSAFSEIFHSKILDYVSETLPLSQLIMSTCTKPYPHILRSCILMLCFGASCFIGGLAVFRRTNLN